MLERVGKYEVLAPLTDGGMAELYLGATAGPGGFRKYVVIKRMIPDAGDDNLERMFLDEARITAAFSHPGIAQVFELGEDGEGLYVVMEFIAGQNLNQVASACAKERAVLPLAFSTSVALECAQALHYAHTFKTAAGEAQGVIHRDVAQKNIMVTYDGQVKLLDFGIAKVKNALSKTKVGTVKGTAGYMSPEQVRGEALDARSDVFSLGIVLWEMVTGHRLFSAQTELEELRMILDAPITPPNVLEPQVPQVLAELVMKALSRDRAGRFASAREFGRALQTRCADLLFDVDGRADFMRSRFGEKIASTQKLFEAASSTMEELERAIVAYRGEVDDGAQSARARKQVPVVLKGKPSSPRAGRVARSKPVSPKPKPVEVAARDEADEAAIDAALAKDKEASAKLKKKKPSAWAPVAVAAAVFGVAFGVYKVLLEPHENVEFVQKNMGLQPISGLEPVPATDAALEDPVAEPVKAEAAPKVTRGVRGEVTLALIPSARVLLNGQQVGSGSMMTLSLPVGTHLLTVVGENGAEHRLSLPVSAGKNKALKFQVDDLPRR
jgi:serine/threonine-protein kinase